MTQFVPASRLADEVKITAAAVPKHRGYRSGGGVAAPHREPPPRPTTLLEYSSNVHLHRAPCFRQTCHDSKNERANQRHLNKGGMLLHIPCSFTIIIFPHKPRGMEYEKRGPTLYVQVFHLGSTRGDLAPKGSSLYLFVARNPPGIL